jgi:ribonuclease BN (tRNA processing enzyme)
LAGQGVGTSNSKKMITLSFIGTGSGITQKGRYPSGLVIDREILVDAPPQTICHLKKMGILPENLKYIFITHFHPDHTLGLVMLAVEWMVLKNRKEPILVIGPEGLEDMLVKLIEITIKDELDEIKSVFRFQELPSQKHTTVIKDLKFESIPLKHSQLNLGYKITWRNKVISVTGDTAFFEGLRDLTKSDVIISEMTSVFERYSMHMIDNLLPLVEMTDENETVYLYHLAYETEDIYKGLKESEDPRAGKILELFNKNKVIIAEDFREYII